MLGSQLLSLGVKLKIPIFHPAIPALVGLPQLIPGMSMEGMIMGAWFCFSPCLATLKIWHHHSQHQQSAGGISPPQQRSHGFAKPGLFTSELKLRLSLLRPALVPCKRCQCVVQGMVMIRTTRVKICRQIISISTCLHFLLRNFRTQERIDTQTEKEKGRRFISPMLKGSKPAMM